MVRTVTPRTIRLIDIENMAGTSQLSELLVRVTQVLIEQVAPKNVADHEVVAVSHDQNAQEAFFSWGGPAQFRLRQGHDGADLALLAELADIEFICARYDRVVIASGDRAFAPAITELTAAGVEVLVIAPAGHTSRAIRRAVPSTGLLYMRTPTDIAAQTALAA